MSSGLVRTDTMINIPSTQGIAYRIGDLNNKRDAVLDDFAPSIPELDLDTFIASLLPHLPLPLPDIDQITLKLINSGEFVMTDQGNFWRAFATEPASSGCSENNTFAALADIYDAVMKHVPANLQATSRLILNPNCAPYSKRTHQTRPDAYMVLNKSSVENGKSDGHQWQDLALTMEFKKSNSDNNRSDNMKKQIFSMQQVMTYDPCRRFTFGLTIENTDIRLWFCSRSAMIVSEKMDFNENPLILIFIFLAFTFASKSNLGWDDTMTSILVGESIQYKIKVGDCTYETIDALSDFAAHTIVGRATRVLLVKDIESHEEFVLKDVWLAKGRQPEHEIRSNLLDDIREKLGEPKMKEVERHLFTPVSHCTVQTRVNGKAVDDDTDEVIMRKVDLSGAGQFNVMDSIQEKHMVELVGQTPHTSEHVNTRAPRPNPTHITHRYHYRIVYEERATPLFGINRLSLVMITLEDLVKVLNTLHRAGWVHRDISAGNVFLFQKHGLKLGDLEYAKKMGKDGEGDVRTGTLDFMSVEVERQRYMFTPVDSNVRFFYHNSLHELESVWWLATWILFFHYPVGTPATESLNAQKAAVNELFPRILPNDRLVFTRVPGEFERIVKSLHVDFHLYGNKLDNLRASLQKAYLNFEANLQESPIEYVNNFSKNPLDDIHETFRLMFREMKEELNRSGKDIELTRLHKVKEDVKRIEPGSDDVQRKRSRLSIQFAEVKRMRQSQV